MNVIKNILKILWFVVEAVCFSVGLMFIIFLLTAYYGGGKVTLNKEDKPVYCFAQNEQQCINTLSEEKKNEQN